MTAINPNEQIWLASAPLDSQSVGDVAVVSPNPAPGPGGRTTRAVAQGGAALALVNLWIAFGWFNADSWDAVQVSSVTVVLSWVVTAIQNVVNYLRAKHLPEA